MTTWKPSPPQPTPLLGLIDDVLDISKIEAGKVAVETTDLDLHRLVTSIVKMLKPDADAKRLYLDVDVDSDVPYHLRGDALHLRQVLINLLGNAIKFTDSGGVRLKVSQVRVDSGLVVLSSRSPIPGSEFPTWCRAGSSIALLKGPFHHPALQWHWPRDHDQQAAGGADGR